MTQRLQEHRQRVLAALGTFFGRAGGPDRAAGPHHGQGTPRQQDLPTPPRRTVDVDELAAPEDLTSKREASR